MLLLVLLIDSEEPVAEGAPVWASSRRGTGLRSPRWAEEAHAYLMVQCVETWLVTDPDALAAHYKQGFKPDKLPKRTNLEDEPKDDVQRKLGEAIGGRDHVYPHGDSAKLIALVILPESRA